MNDDLLAPAGQVMVGSTFGGVPTLNRSPYGLSTISNWGLSEPVVAGFLGAQGYTCEAWLALTLAQKRALVLAREQVSVDETVRNIDAHCARQAPVQPSWPLYGLPSVGIPSGYLGGQWSSGFNQWPFFSIGQWPFGGGGWSGGWGGRRRIRPAGQVAVTDSAVGGTAVLGSLLGLAVSIGVMYGAAYYGARAGVRSRK